MITRWVAELTRTKEARFYELTDNEIYTAANKKQPANDAKTIHSKPAPKLTE